ncbi:DUF4296 domain-containing protein [Psychroflexus planctonicus]|uniref:DUF4296 domain-containing protein n=1 Tax=Psychroflexus planctonicus TaxID=1526575 RepID=A0ABQ1SGH8_9FLAO|nr:DUF4296 domain-containing protein [Psychroflexus planctonicus]GGE38835.1 hypothetical protein GCM10010832_18880 [Psychroflexus planctonicus]
MFRNILIIFILLVFGSCQDVQLAQKPNNLLSPEEMENVLTDMVLLDAMISVNNFRIDKHKIDVRNFVFDKYEIDSLTLSKNIEYYNEQYEVNTEIYKNVKTKIEELKLRVENDKKLQDSIERVKKEAKRSTDTLLKRNR